MFALPPTLTIDQARATVRAIEDQLGQDGSNTAALVVDAGALANFDTSAIAVLLEARRLARAAGRALEVRGAPRSMVELSGLYGVDALLGFDAQSARA